MFDREQNRLQDEEMKMLAIEAQGHPYKSKERQKALTKLVDKIIKSGRLSRSHRYIFGERYEEIYEEVIQDLLLYICQKIDQYKPERGPVMRWVNFLLSKRFFNDVIRHIFGPPNVKIEQLDPSNLEQLEKEPLLLEMLWEYLENDPEQLCKNLRHPKYPEVNFQLLVMRKIRGEKWKTISAELEVPISTLNGFYRKSLKELSPRIRLYLNK
ncbi:MAG TPA: hypothetical protein VK211_24680 [Kamptonema sp.]|nr:hypothetical protein [Kamptonema sp.]